MNEAVPDPGSFRDPGSRVYVRGERILRAIMQANAPAYLAVRESGLFESLAAKRLLLPSHEVAADEKAGSIPEALHTLEHPRIPFISYPYEWSFALHRAAALLHLDLHLEALKSGFTLSDATAYNVQFRGTEPVFIDHLSLRPYSDGEIWVGHRQFCMQFLNPLLFWSHLRLPPNQWFRGSLEGIAPEEIAPLLPMRAKLSWTVLSHVTAQAALQRRQVAGHGQSADKLRSSRLPKTAFVGMLTGLRNYIAGLRPPSDKTVWADYANSTSYTDREAATKRAFIKEMVAAIRPSLLFDLGCNTGDYSQAALEAGAAGVVGFDFDYATLDRAFDRFDKSRSPFLPLWMDAANPSPSQGWAQAERKGLQQRARADALIALAFIHHIVIGRNVPLDMTVEWITGLAPAGVIEFPPKSDPMVQRLLVLRQDVFPDYGEEAFLASLNTLARVVAIKRVSENGRLLVWYERPRKPD